MTPESRVRRTVKAAWQDMDGETVLLIGEEAKLVGLNASAARIWHLADGTRTVAEIAGELARDFEAIPQTIGEETLAFIQSLAARGLIEVAP